MCRNVSALAVLAVPGLLIALATTFGRSGEGAQEINQQPVPKAAAVATANSAKEPRIVEQSFPPNGPMETAWKVEWDTEIGFGLVIKNAWFKSGPAVPWMQVMGDARVGDIFVAYQPGTPRFWDTALNFRMSNLSATDAGPNGKLHYINNGAEKDDPCMCQEVRDRGIIWKNNSGSRRGHVLALWGCLHAVNYRYLIEYGFQDDGCIVFRMGATGRNLQGNEWTPHMHNYYWRVNMAIDGKDHNTAYLMEVVEPRPDGNKMASKTFHKLFNDGKEGWADWEPAKFSMLRVVNPVKKNIRGETFAYDLMALRAGSSRHNGTEEECTHHDFWVTKADPKELRYRYVPKYCNNESIVDTDIVIWYGTSMFHEPRSEDGIMENGNTWNGTTLVNWSGFTLRPNNVFDRTPLYPNPKEPEQPKRKGKGKD